MLDFREREKPSQAKKDRGDGELIRRWRCAGDGVVLLQRGNKCEPVHSVVAALMTTQQQQQQQQPKGGEREGEHVRELVGVVSSYLEREGTRAANSSPTTDAVTHF